jgi:hypothetical protein
LPCRRGNGKLVELLPQRAIHESGDLCFGEQAGQPTEQIAHRARQPLDVRWVAEPVDDERARGDPCQPRTNDRRRQPLFLDHRDDALDDFCPSRGEDGGVRDGQAERMAEERRHGKPVSEPAHERGLKTGRQDAEPRRVG